MAFGKKFGGQKGFSLVELLVVVGIIGVLAAVGVPRYQKYMASSRNAGALALSADVAKAQEAWHIANATYGTSAQILTSNLASLPAPWATTQGAITGPSTTAWSWSISANAGGLGSCQTANHTVTRTEAGLTLGQTVAGCL